MTATLTLTHEQLLSLFAQLDPRAKREVLYQLAEDAVARRESRMAAAEEALQRRAAERGLKWEQMSEDERAALVDDLIHAG
jgi:hypothetical protein